MRFTGKGGAGQGMVLNTTFFRLGDVCSEQAGGHHDASMTRAQSDDTRQARGDTALSAADTVTD